MEQTNELYVAYNGPECIIAVENDHMPDNHLARIEFPDTKMVVELRDDALDFFQQKVRSIGDGVLATLTMRIPCNIEFLKAMGGFTVVAPGLRALSEEECLTVARAYMEQD